MVIKNYVKQKTFINFYKSQFKRLVKEKPSKNDLEKKNAPFWSPKTPMNDILILIYDLPSTFSTLST